MTAIEKIVCFTDRSQEKGVYHGMRTTWGRTQTSQGRHGQEPFLWFPWEGMGEAG